MNEELKERLGQQELISEISRSFISSDNTQMLVNKAIAKLGNYFNVSSVAIYCLDDQNKDTDLTYHWSADQSSKDCNSEDIKTPDRIKLNVHELIKTCFPERLYDNSTLPVISCVDTAASKTSSFCRFVDDNVSAFICAPLYVEGKLWGVLIIEQCKTPREWTDNQKSFIAVAASTIAGAIMLDTYNTKLKNAVTELTAASKAKSEFLSNMSHEMRTPMNAIINMTAIAKKTHDVKRKNYALDKIGDASTHLLGVINDILDMSKIEAKKFELVPVEFNFEKTINKAVNVVNFRVTEKHQKLTVQIDKNIPKIMIGDDQRISQVITNLLGNAVKFTPEKGSINLNTQFLGEENGVCTIKISVTDTGIGISKEHQTHLFQSFHQAESSTSRKYGGTGLGLSISKSFVEMMGGKIWVESENNKGSAFSFTMQTRRSQKNDQQQDISINEEKKQIKPVPAIEDYSEFRILLVEDMEINREIVLMLLESTKINIDCAENGLLAVEMFIDEPYRYNIIFMDIHMPGMDGYEATRRIRMYEDKIRQNPLRLKDNPNPDLTNDSMEFAKQVEDSTSFTYGETRSNNWNPHRRIPIIAMTANVFKEDIEHCLKAGMDDHLGKPLDLEIIMEKLNFYLK
ncbi:MAG: ATP-binding protein [Treponema sp.]|nr:ATP-binding protein [Treponema sp.]